ncbi:NAD(P)-dependent oxidoreductase [Rhodobacteraceae bacterium 63075]|nr:NAD(P)-dependent oxidoreductase [Rhodobacteraceae bacterium 63075]
MGTLKILITGAGGALGRACVEEALARGHEVVALRRRAGETPQGATGWTSDLIDGLPGDALANVDAVLHIAASVSNDPAALKRDTIDATRALTNSLAALAEKPLVVLASTISVYDADLPRSLPVKESSALETRAGDREPYMRAKLYQEQCVQDAGITAWALRIGAVYSECNFWNAHIGFRKGPLLVSLGRNGEVPTVHLNDAAGALLSAAETDPMGQFEAVNIVEDVPPKRREVIAALAPAIHLPLHWSLLIPFANVAHRLFGARAPGLLQPRILRARMSNRSYDNSRAKSRLGWQPERRFGEMTSKPEGPA